MATVTRTEQGAKFGAKERLTAAAMELCLPISAALAGADVEELPNAILVGLKTHAEPARCWEELTKIQRYLFDAREIWLRIRERRQSPTGEYTLGPVKSYCGRCRGSLLLYDLPAGTCDWCDCVSEGERERKRDWLENECRAAKKLLERVSPTTTKEAGSTEGSDFEPERQGSAQPA